MSFVLLLGAVGVLGIATLATVARRRELRRMERSLRSRESAARQGGDRPQLRHPVIDRSRCLGCATCVSACPEDGVLEMVHGQATVVGGARCMGYASCEAECPTGAITVALANLEERRDVPVLEESLEAVGSPGLFLAGEVTAHGLIRAAIEQGTRVAAEVACRSPRAHPPSRPPVASPAVSLAGNGASILRNGALLACDATPGLARAGSSLEDPPEEPLDLLIVGAGPAGLACALEAKRRGLRFVAVDRAERPGGTVATYPRRKMVLTRPVDLPLHGRLAKTSYRREELVGLWNRIVRESRIPFRGGETLEGIDREPGGAYRARTSAATYRARHVCLALGRRGTPRRLGVPGEDFPKVAYSLVDARSLRDRHVLVVGGGDSAVEAALGLAEQPGNDVTLSYRKESFFRIRTRNEERLRSAVADGKLRVLHRSEVRAIRQDAVDLVVRGAAGHHEVHTLPNDDVFVMAGGTPPVALLESAGVSFDPALRPPSRPIVEQGSGLTRALAVAFALSLVALVFALFHADYYRLPAHVRPEHPKHEFLRPGLGVGLALGIAAAALVGMNLLYLLRRAPWFPLRLGSLRLWMTSHVATGVLAFLCAVLHAAMEPRETVGGYAFWALVALCVTGAIGRYFYAYVPRAANGRELELAEVKGRLEAVFEGFGAHERRFGEQARAEVEALVRAKQWKRSFVGRVAALVAGQRDLRRLLARLAAKGRQSGVPEAAVRETLRLARRAHRIALMAAHYEDLRAILATWRYLHRWVAALMVALIVVHVLFALVYGAFFFGRGG